MSVRSRILIIDDDLAVRLRLCDLLAQAGDFDVDECADGPTGLARAEEFRPDLVLLDIMMPGMSGFEVCARLRATPVNREVPVIVLSAAEESEAMIRALEAGADDFLRKPFSAPELRAKVRSIARLNRVRTIGAERDRFRWLLDQSLEPLAVTDGAGRIVYANHRARELFGLRPDNGGDLPAAAGRQFQAEPTDAWAAWREGRLGAGGAFVLHQPETAQVPARWFNVHLHAFGGDGEQTLFKFTDRSAAVRRELEAYTFQHLIAHKIRTPLNGLAPILEFIEASGAVASDPETAELLTLARASAARLEDTLAGVLAYHEAVMGRRTRDRAGTAKPVPAVVAAAGTAAGLTVGAACLGEPAAVCDGELLEIVLTELFENYLKFSEAARTGVEVRSRRLQDDGLELRLFAPGPGLPPDVVAQLGRPYAQLEKSFSGEVPGLGLGLATVRLLLRSIGGELTFAPGTEIAGLVAAVRLPAGAVDRTGMQEAR